MAADFPKKVGRLAFTLFAVGLTMALGSGCALLRKRHKTRPAQVAAAPRFVGTIAMVNEDERFVLIDADYSNIFDSGTPLKSFTGTAESGALRMSPERRRPFFAADIVSGSPQKGDGVWQSLRNDAAAQISSSAVSTAVSR